MRLRLPRCFLPSVVRERAINALIRRALRSPYSHINDYMARYWIVPYRDPSAGEGCGPVSFWRRPFARLIQHFGIAVRIHHIKRSDNDRAFHDHPWWYVTLLLRGGYFEVQPKYKQGLYCGETHTWRRPGTVLFRRAKSWHRLVLVNGSSAWTLFITGPKTRAWGFLAEPRHKIYWRDYLKDREAKQ